MTVSESGGFGRVFGVEIVLDVVVATEDAEIWLRIKQDRLSIAIASVWCANAVFCEDGSINWETVEDMVCECGAVNRNDDVVGAGFPNFVDLFIELGASFGV